MLVEAAARRALAGQCIAVPARLTAERETPNVVGRPEHPVHRWARELFGEGPVEAAAAEESPGASE